MTEVHTATPRRPMTILFLNHVSAMGGAERSLLDLVGNLDRAKHTAVAVIPAPGPLADALEKAGARVVHLPLQRFVKTSNPLALLGYMVSLMKVARQIKRLIREERIDLVHSNSSTAHLYGGLAARLAGVPCLWHCRDLVDLGLPGRWMAGTATRIIAISGAVAQALERYGHTGKVVIIHNGLDTEAFRPVGAAAEIRKELGVRADDYVVAMAGQLVPWKNHALFLRAAGLIAADVPNARFLVLGDDLFDNPAKYKGELESLTRQLKLVKRVQFLGYRSDFVRLLEAVDVLVHPADREPFGRVVAEAMAMSRPVVAVGAAGPAEIIRHGEDGILVGPHHPEEIAKAVVRLAKDASFAGQLGQAARRRIETRFSLERHVAKVQAVYAELTGQEPAAMKLAYVLGEFPSISETFILREIQALQDHGLDMLLFSLRRPSSPKLHADAKRLLGWVRYPAPFLSARSLRNHAHLLRAHPGLYVQQAFGAICRGPRALRNFRLAADFAAEADRQGVAHIHAHFAFMPADIGIVMARLLGKPFSLSAHARDIYTQAPAVLAGKIARATFVAACTEHGARYLKQLLPDLAGNRIVMIPHGIDPARFAPAASTRRLVLAVGRLEEKKGFAYLIKACGIMATKGIDFSCILAGTGPLENELAAELGRSNPGERIRLLGEVTQDELQELLREAQVLVAPSVPARDGDRDGIPNVLLEAMAMGLPVVATTAGAIPEAITHEENGLLVPPADPEAMAKAIELLLGDPALRQRLGEAGRARVIKQFDISKNTAKLAALFKESFELLQGVKS